MIKITETKDRGVLNEGRDSNMGFALLNNTGKNKYETVNPFSPCKDYLAEVVFTEQTGIPTKGCGLDYPKKLNIFDNKAYLGIVIQKTKSGGYYGIVDYSTDTKWLNDNYNKLQVLINKFEDILELKGKTKIEEAENNHYLVTLPLEWVQSTYSISLVTLLLRAGQVYNGTDSIESFINSYPDNKIDSYLMKDAAKNIKIILENKKLPTLPKTWVEAASKDKFFSPHHNGICAWNGKYEDPYTMLNEDEEIVELTKE